MKERHPRVKVNREKKVRQYLNEAASPTHSSTATDLQCRPKMTWHLPFYCAAVFWQDDVISNNVHLSFTRPPPSFHQYHHEHLHHYCSHNHRHVKLAESKIEKSSEIGNKNEILWGMSEMKRSDKKKKGERENN